MDALEFIKERNRMCKSFDDDCDCSNSPLVRMSAAILLLGYQKPHILAHMESAMAQKNVMCVVVRVMKLDAVSIPKSAKKLFKPILWLLRSQRVSIVCLILRTVEMEFAPASWGRM